MKSREKNILKYKPIQYEDNYRNLDSSRFIVEEDIDNNVVSKKRKARWLLLYIRLEDNNEQGN